MMGGIDVVSEPATANSNPHILYHVHKGNVITACLKRKILGITYYAVGDAVGVGDGEGWICGEVSAQKQSVLISSEVESLLVPTVLLTDFLNATKRFDLERLERRTLSAQIVRLLIQCYGLCDARRVASSALSLALSLPFCSAASLPPRDLGSRVSSAAPE